MITGGLFERRLLTRLHLFRMLPCQLFFLALNFHSTTGKTVLLGHQLLDIDPIRFDSVFESTCESLQVG
jgi:hypothetical protein